MLRASSLHVVLVATILTGAACSRQADDSSKPVTETVAAAEPTPVATPPPESTPPAPTEKANLAAADMGGAVEEITGSYGPGFTGRRLVDGLDAPTWKVETAPPVEVPYPQEAVISFFEREPAFVDAVQLVLPEAASNAPKDVEIWTTGRRIPRPPERAELSRQPGNRECRQARGPATYRRRVQRRCRSPWCRGKL
jgi:hypothetical protein